MKLIKYLLSFLLFNNLISAQDSMLCFKEMQVELNKSIASDQLTNQFKDYCAKGIIKTNPTHSEWIRNNLVTELGKFIIDKLANANSPLSEEELKTINEMLDDFTYQVSKYCLKSTNGCENSKSIFTCASNIIFANNSQIFGNFKYIRLLGSRCNQLTEIFKSEEWNTVLSDSIKQYSNWPDAVKFIPVRNWYRGNLDL